MDSTCRCRNPRRIEAANYGIKKSPDNEAGDYLTRALIFSNPALAQASSKLPPGAPPTPIAAITSSPTLMRKAPGNSRMCGQLRQAAGRRRATDALRNRAARILIARSAEHQHRVSLVVRSIERGHAGAIAAQ